MSIIRPSIEEERATHRNQLLYPENVVELLAQYNARARYAAEGSRKDIHDTWHQAMDLLLSATGIYTPAPCFCKFVKLI